MYSDKGRRSTVRKKRDLQKWELSSKGLLIFTLKMALLKGDQFRWMK